MLTFGLVPKTPMAAPILNDVKICGFQSPCRLERSRFASGGRFRVRLIRHLRLPG
jgi:hypothetical protein